MKRALTTFGNPFGLALYDKEQRGVRPTRKKNGPKIEGRPVSWMVFSSTGEPMNEFSDPVEYCSSVRLLLETIRDKDQIEAFWQKNQPTVAALHQGLPELATEKGEHYADILCSLYARGDSRSSTAKGMVGEVGAMRGPEAWTRPSSVSRFTNAFATGNTFAVSPPSRALSADGALVRLTMSDTRNPER